MPYLIIGESGYDDFYQISLANSIYNGEWLGDYNYTTLIKGVSYPLFVAVSNYLALPYPFALALYLICSACIFCYALNHITSNRWVCLASYAIIIFCPVSFAEPFIRLYRMAIIYPAVLICFSSMFLIYLNRDRPIRCLLPWMLLDGFSFFFFYYIREDSIWLFPLFIASLLLCGIWYIWFSQYGKKEIIRRGLMLLIPLCIFISGTCIYKAVNYSYYGVATTNDRSLGSFAEMTGNMIRVEDETETDKNYWISRSKLERIIDACPSLAKDKEYILETTDNWNNYKGDMTVWGIRIALNGLGYYSDAKEVETFCKQVNQELLDAVKSGQLSFDKAIHFTTQCQGVYSGEIIGYIRESIKNACYVSSFKWINIEPQISSGTEEQIRFVESVTCVNSIKPINAVSGNAEDYNSGDYNLVTSQRAMNVAQNIVDAGKVIGMILIPLSLVCYVALWAVFIKRRKWIFFEPVIILTGLLLSIALFEFGITVFNEWIGIAGIQFYSTGMTPLVQSFELLSVAYLYEKVIRKRITKKWTFF